MRFLLPHAITTGAERHPERQAIRISGKSLSYADLELRSNALANTLLAQGLTRGERVGIFMNKGLESGIAIYGIMKAGGAYVPLDPFAPVSRIGYVIKDCGIRTLLTNEIKREQVKQMLTEGKALENIIGLQASDDLPVRSTSWEEALESDTTLPALNLTEQDLAYILYTSGSTGVPKGIMHTHRSGLSFAEWAADTYGLVGEDQISNHAPLHFDLSTFDFFSSAVAGATTVIVPEALTKFPSNLSRLMEEERISVWYSVPFALIQLMEHGGIQNRDLSALRWILFAGEVFPTKHLRQLMSLLPDIRFSNLFGPTETNVCTYYHVEEIPLDTDETIPIGKPCANIEDLVLDLDDRPVEQGEVGELLIRGGVVMKGYWGQSDKTDKSFYQRSAFDQFNDIFYRTGDLVQLDTNGNYRYLGRKDRQIKTRGYRVELDEVEVALLSHTSVKEAAAFVVPDNQGSNLIEAAITLNPRNELVLADIIEHISQHLPPYAIPSRIDILDEFPRTSTGKIDRRELQSRAKERLTL